MSEELAQLRVYIQMLRDTAYESVKERWRTQNFRSLSVEAGIVDQCDWALSIIDDGRWRQIGPVKGATGFSVGIEGDDE